MIPVSNMREGEIENNFLPKGNVRIYSWVLSSYLAKVIIIFFNSKRKTNPQGFN